MKNPASRRSFLRNVGLASLGAVAAGGWSDAAGAEHPDAKILGAAGVKTSARPKGVWKPVSDRKIRVGIVGYGVCQFGAAFGFQDHPNVTVAAVSDLIPERCRELAKVCRCEKTYPSLEELVKDDTLEAVFVATDAPSHARHCIEVLKHGKHVASAVPAVFGIARRRPRIARSGQVERAEVHDVRDLGLPRRLPRHAADLSSGRFRQAHLQRRGVLPLHADADRVVSRLAGRASAAMVPHALQRLLRVRNRRQLHRSVAAWACPASSSTCKPENNRYKNPFGTEIALLRTSEGGMARMAVSWDTHGPETEAGRVRGQRGAMWGVSVCRDGKEVAQPGPSALAAQRRPGRPRRLARPPD